MSPSEPAAPAYGATIGWVDEPRSEGIVGPRVRVTGWALADARHSRRRAALRGSCVSRPLRAAAARRRRRATRLSGQSEQRLRVRSTIFRRYPAPAGVDRRTLDDRRDRARRQRDAARRAHRSIEPSPHARWRFLRDARRRRRSSDARRCRASRPAALSASNTRYARVRVADDPRRHARADPLPAHDDAARRRLPLRPGLRRQRAAAARARSPTTRSSQVLAHAIARDLPVLVTLNGGIWADAAGTCPDWDVNDQLEEDAANCQWNEHDEVMPDDYLKHLPGSQEAPELARALTLNVYARDVRDYKKRNLQQAARPLVDVHARASGSLRRRQPRSRRLHQSVLRRDAVVRLQPGHAARSSASGSPAPARTPASRTTARPICRAIAGAAPLSLAEVCAIARRHVRDVGRRRSAARVSARPATPVSGTTRGCANGRRFRRHLVRLHYDELAQWLVEAGFRAIASGRRRD